MNLGSLLASRNGYSPKREDRASRKLKRKHSPHKLRSSADAAAAAEASRVPPLGLGDKTVCIRMKSETGVDVEGECYEPAFICTARQHWAWWSGAVV